MSRSAQSEKFVLGVFPDEDKTVSAIDAIKRSAWKLDRVHSPFPSHKILGALDLKKSRVGYFTLTGGILGFIVGLCLAIYTAVQWHLIVSGKPVIAWYPFFIVAFEFTILFSVLGNIVGLVIQTRLPEFDSLEQYDPRCSEDHFGIVASCDEKDQEGLMDCFRKEGGEVRLVEQ
jgi:molybdopterin-containing oxidoreductase family membrane subunit